MRKFFITEESVFNYPKNCYTEKDIKKYMIDNGLTELVVNEAKINKIDNYIFCKRYKKVFLSPTCLVCKFYVKKEYNLNQCRHVGRPYECTDKKVNIKIK